MTIGIDISQTAFRGTGVARYTASLVKALTTYDTEHNFVFFYSSLRMPLDPSLRSSIHKPHRIVEYKIPPTLLSFMWNTLRFPSIETFVGYVDIFMTSDWTEPPAKNALKISTLHDMIMYTYPETVQATTGVDITRAKITPNIVAQHTKRHAILKKEATGIFVDSLHTKIDVEKFLDIPSNRLHLLYPGVEIEHIHTAWHVVQKKYNITTPFFLSVGKQEPRKNISRLIDAFLQSEIKDTQLFIVGSQGWGKKPRENTERIHFLGYVPDSDLATLYAHAEFFVFPSLYEGFGYPIVEAMGYGCAVTCSNSSSLSEIGKDAVLFFDPEKTKSIADALKTLHIDAALRTSLVKKGSQRYKDFSLQNFNDNFVKIVDKIYHDNRR